MELGTLNIRKILEGYQKKELKPSELIAAYLKNIEKKNPKLNAFLQVRSDETLKRAKELDGKISDAAKLPLFGVPIAIKDNFLVKGWQATAWSKVLEGYTSLYTATTVSRLEAARAVVIGKVNCDEF